MKQISYKEERMKKIVELKNVSKVYKAGEKEFKALDDIDLSINKGEFVVVLGHQVLENLHYLI